MNQITLTWRTDVEGAAKLDTKSLELITQSLNREASREMEDRRRRSKLINLAVLFHILLEENETP